MDNRKYALALITCSSLVMFYLCGHLIGQPSIGFLALAAVLLTMTIISKYKTSSKRASRSAYRLSPRHIKVGK
ncbi:hypothetical protein [Thalassotalea aquiviva]|uniref:hypothetical protein n=1 Tax=Thalassotalea aquiviva TaxID=3242415 RepID=UPI003529E063